MIPYAAGRVGAKLVTTISKKIAKQNLKKKQKLQKYYYKLKQAHIKRDPLYGAGTTKVIHRGFKSPIIRTQLAKSNYSKLKWT